MFANKIIVFAGFRDANLVDRIYEEGGLVKNTIVNNTNLLVFKRLGKAGSKYEEAQKRNIEIMELDQFMYTFFPARPHQIVAKLTTKVVITTPDGIEYETQLNTNVAPLLQTGVQFIKNLDDKTIHITCKGKDKIDIDKVLNSFKNLTSY